MTPAELEIFMTPAELEIFMTPAEVEIYDARPREVGLL